MTSLTHHDDPAPHCFRHIVNAHYGPFISVMTLHLACSFVVGVVIHRAPWSRRHSQHRGFALLLGERVLGPQSLCWGAEGAQVVVVGEPALPPERSPYGHLTGGAVALATAHPAGEGQRGGCS